MSNDDSNTQNSKITLRDIIFGNFFSKVGLKFDQQHLQDYHDAINNPVVYSQIQEDIQQLANAVNPTIQATSDKIAKAWNKSLHSIQQNGLKTLVGAIPVVGQVIDEVDNVNRTINSGLSGINSITNIASDELQEIENKFKSLNPVNQLAEKVGEAQNAAQNAAQNVVQEKLLPITSKIGKTQAQINKVNQAKIDANNFLVPESNLQTGGAKVLSRIQKSVKEFVNQSQSKSKKGKKSKKSKKKLNIPKNKTNKILSRIKESVKEFINL
jgi:hypothetical protein